MRTVFAFSALITVAVNAAGAQQTVAPASIPAPEQVKLANDVPGLVAPVLRPLEITSAPDPGCYGTTRGGTVGLSLIVDTQGSPRNVILAKPVGNELDYLAVHFAETVLFEPATLNGAPAGVAGTLELKVEACEQFQKDSQGNQSLSLHPLGTPKMKFDVSTHAPGTAKLSPAKPPLVDISLKNPTDPQILSGITPPVVLNRVDADFSDYAREHHIQGSCLYRVLVDEHGLPQDFQIVKPLDPSLRQQASEAVHEYRFKPATLQGMPIRAHIFIEINFQHGRNFQ